MIPQIESGSHYFSHKIQGIINCFYVNRMGGLTPIFNEPQIDVQEERLSTDAVKCCYENLKNLKEEYDKSGKQLALCLTRGSTSNVDDFGGGLTKWIIDSPKVRVLTLLCLKNLGLRQLPIQLQLLDCLEFLDISDNELLFLHPCLQRLPLKTLDISGKKNKNLLPLPKWLAKMDNLLILIKGMDLKSLPSGFNPEQIECEKKFSKRKSRDDLNYFCI